MHLTLCTYLIYELVRSLIAFTLLTIQHGIARPQLTPEHGARIGATLIYSA